MTPTPPRDDGGRRAEQPLQNTPPGAVPGALPVEEQHRTQDEATQSGSKQDTPMDEVTRMDGKRYYIMADGSFMNAEIANPIVKECQPCVVLSSDHDAALQQAVAAQREQDARIAEKFMRDPFVGDVIRAGRSR